MPLTIDQLADHLVALADVLDVLTPPPPSAAPNVRDQWRTLTAAARTIAPGICQLLTESTPSPTASPPTSPPHVFPSSSPPASPQPASRTASPRPPSPPPPAPRARAPTRTTIVARANRIAAAFASPPLQPEDVLDLVAGHVHSSTRSTPQAEDSGLTVLCRGYARVAHVDWPRLLTPLHTPVPQATQVQEASLGFSDAADAHTRMLLRHEYLAGLDLSFAGASWPLYVVATVEALRFALDWNGQPKGTRHKFYVAQFVRHHPALQDELNPAKVIRDNMADEFHHWQRQSVEPAVTGRNRLLALYNIFGSAVLLDPLWRVSQFHSSRSFTTLLANVYSLVPPADDQAGPAATLDQQHQDAMHVLENALTVLAGALVTQSVLDFLHQHRPTFAL